MRARPKFVALRYLTKKAAIIEPPPVLLEKVSDWMVSVYAGHILAQVERGIDRVTAVTHKWEEQLKRFEGIKRDLPKIMDSLQAGKHISWKIPEVYTDGSVSWSVIGVRRYKHDINLRGEPAFEKGEGKARAVFREWMERSEVEKWASRKLEAVVDNLRGAIQALKGKAGGATRPETLVELLLMRRECLKYTNKAKLYRTKTTKKFEVNLTGWKYVRPNSPVIRKINETRSEYNTELDEAIAIGERELNQAVEFWDLVNRRGRKVETAAKKIYGKMLGGLEEVAAMKKPPDDSWQYVDAPIFGSNWSGRFTTRETPLENARSMRMELLEPDDIIEALAERRFDRITCVLNFAGHKKRGGRWTEVDRTLEVDVEYGRAKSVESTRKGIRATRGTCRHEMQHVAQTLIEVIEQLRGDRAGLPPLHVRKPEIDPSGYTPSSKRVPHEERDVEFYTNLMDDIDDLEDSLRRVPKMWWPEWTRVFVGLSHYKLLSHAVHEQYGRGLPSLQGQRIRNFRQSNRAKWRKAIRELYKEMRSRGYRLEGGKRPEKPKSEQK